MKLFFLDYFVGYYLNEQVREQSAYRNLDQTASKLPMFHTETNTNLVDKNTASKMVVANF